MRAWWLLAVVACGSGDDDKGDEVPSADTGAQATTAPTTSLPTDSDLPTTDTVVLTRPGGGCVLLSGGQDRIRATDAVVPTGGDPRTLQVWVRTTSRSDQVALSQGLAAPELAVYLGTSGGHAMVTNGGLPHVDTDLFVADGEWHHLLVTMEEQTATLWLDGHQGQTFDIVTTTSDGEVVGGGTPTGDLIPWQGWLDDAKIFRRVRLPAEIEADLDGDDTALALWWDFELTGAGAGLTVPDVSGQGGDGVTGGTPKTPAFRACP